MVTQNKNNKEFKTWEKDTVISEQYLCNSKKRVAAQSLVLTFLVSMKQSEMIGYSIHISLGTTIDTKHT